jgi:ATP-dependent Zn protease
MLLTKAITGEMKVTFFQASGSSFDEELVGVVPHQVHNLFSLAKFFVPSIVFY